ncbi:MAG TPA: BadF/BadG/BcrA/BcrD ATPase family protein [Acidobacteriaceae bacterium]|jgi:N-acetylglucosamine kinase-like BadF-type ATPase|nr:BadF/BadG/BcrA/BcrD ATPase family protein [Acidobacteriaceae bacterium]
MHYFLGIDAGGTITRCALAQGTDVLARSDGGSIKITRVSEAEAEKNLERMLSALAAQSGIALRSVTGTCVGLSGYMIAPVADWVRNALEARVSGPIYICGDEEIALDAAFHGGAGILVIAGTGSNVVGRTSQGRQVHAGGWGPILSDQGSGNGIGLQALRAIFYAIDASEETSMLPAVHAAWNTQTIEDLIDLGNRIPGPDFSQLAPLVAQCAEEGDGVARRVLQRAGEDLADLVFLAMRQGASFEAAPSSNPWTVAFSGSVVHNISLVRESMIAAIHRLDPTVQFLLKAPDPVLGAVWRASQSDCI